MPTTDRRRLDSLSAGAARRLALAAQGFADVRPQPSGATVRHLSRVMRRVGLVQIDSVNVLVRSQELPLFARLGPHRRTLIPDATRAGRLFEYWGHEASHIPVEHHRLFRWRMAAAQAGQMWSGLRELQHERPELVEAVYRRVRDDGPVVAGEIEQRTERNGPWWSWGDAKRALELLFWTGRLTARRRERDFARIYDVPERMLPAAALDAPTPPEDDARRELLLLAAGHLGVATVGDLADYHRQNIVVARARVHELVDDGRLVPVAVEGWRHTGYVLPGTVVPRRVAARALLSPFDSLIWDRGRVHRLFGMHYRVEIYTPAPRRQFGYYVLPFLLGDRLVARVDLKSDRARSTLLVNAAFAEPEVEADDHDVAGQLAAELGAMAGWLNLERVAVAGRGDLAARLAAAVAASQPPAATVSVC